jgi:four helix bundle protein
MALAVKICRDLIPLLPSCEKWSLAEQLRRSSQSVPANIAEGYGRFYYQEGVRFCYIARGSLEETYSHITLAYKLKYIPDEIYKDIAHEIEGLLRMLHGYIHYLKESKRGATEPGYTTIREEPPIYSIDITSSETSAVEPPDSLNNDMPEHPSA